MEPTRGAFSSEIAKQVHALSEADRKKLLRQGPVTAEALKAITADSNKGKRSSIAKGKKGDEASGNASDKVDADADTNGNGDD
jgi:hypothetical protein